MEEKEDADRSTKISNMSYTAHHEVSDDHRKKKERNARLSKRLYAAPHRLYPFSAQNAKDDHERMQEVNEVPTKVCHWVVVPFVVLAEYLHSHNSKDEDDDGKNEAEVT